jgi:hypothetical protein
MAQTSIKDSFEEKITAAKVLAQAALDELEKQNVDKKNPDVEWSSIREPISGL